MLDLPSHDVLVSEHVPHSALINWHALLVCVVESLLLMSVTILDVEVLSLGQLCDLLQLPVVHSLVHERFGEDLALSTASMSVLDQVEHSFLLIVAQVAHAFHKFLKFFLGVLVGFILSQCRIVELSDEVFELRHRCVSSLKQIFTQVVLIVEFGNFSLWI